MGAVTKVLFLDLATRFGWADVKDRVLRHGSYQLPSTGDNIGRFLNAYELWAKNVFGSYEAVFYEAPLIRSSKQGGIQTGIMTARKLMGLSNVTEMACDRLNIACREVHNQTISAHFIGRYKVKGRDEKKRKTIDVCRDMGFAVKNDDEADAIALRDFIMNEYKIDGLPTGGPLFKEA